MEREPSAGSSNIKSVGFEGEEEGSDNGLMEVEFQNGGVYRYSVPRQVFEDFKEAGFRGGHFHRCIRSQFKGTRA